MRNQKDEMIASLKELLEDKTGALDAAVAEREALEEQMKAEAACHLASSAEVSLLVIVIRQ